MNKKRFIEILDSHGKESKHDLFIGSISGYRCIILKIFGNGIQRVIEVYKPRNYYLNEYASDRLENERKLEVKYSIINTWFINWKKKNYKD